MESSQAVKLGQIKVLVVNEDVEARNAVQQVLAAGGYDVTVASGGFEALMRLETGLRPDLIILDVMLGLMSGWEFRRRQLGNPGLRGIPALLLSAPDNLELHCGLLATHSCLPAPVEPQMLLEKVESLLAAPLLPCDGDHPAPGAPKERAPEAPETPERRTAAA